MADQIIIKIDDKETADDIQRELASNGIYTNHLSPSQMISFGMQLGSIKASPHEFLLLVSYAPFIVDLLFDVLDRFNDRIKLFINGKQSDIIKKNNQPTNPMKEWLRSLEKKNTY